MTTPEISTSCKHLLASSPNPPELVMSALEADGGTEKLSILELGSGNGRIVKIIREQNPSSLIVALENDSVLCGSLQDDFWGLGVVLAEAKSLPFGNESFHRALAINATHEICAASSASDRYDNFRLLIRGVRKVLKPNGEFVLFDGVMPGNEDEQIQMKAKSQEASAALSTFIETYTGGAVWIRQISEQEYSLTMADLATFLTKFPYIDTDYWETEREQLYPFLSLKQMVDAINSAGLNIVSVDHPTKRAGLDRFFDYYDVAGYSQDNFPQVQVLIQAKRVE